MPTLRLVFPVVLAALSGCATVQAAPAALAPAAVTLDWPDSAKALDHHDAFMNGALKVGLITLQGGATMPEHASPLPVLLTAGSGSGTVTTATARFPLDPTHAVFLPGGERHAVIAAEGATLLIAVIAVTGAAAVHPHGH